jgi:hypothetical protein
MAQIQLRPTPLKVWLNSYHHLETNSKYNKMVLAQPPNQHVMKAFDLTGKVAVVTGTVSPNHQKHLTNTLPQEALVESVLKSRGHWLKPVQM